MCVAGGDTPVPSQFLFFFHSPPPIFHFFPLYILSPADGHAELAAADDLDGVRAAADKVPALRALFEKVPFGGDATSLDRAFYEAEVSRMVLMFEQQFHFGVYYSYLKLREQEIRNLMWTAECVAQGQHSRVEAGVVPTF